MIEQLSLPFRKSKPLQYKCLEDIMKPNLFDCIISERIGIAIHGPGVTDIRQWQNVRVAGSEYDVIGEYDRAAARMTRHEDFQPLMAPTTGEHALADWQRYHRQPGGEITPSVDEQTTQAQAIVEDWGNGWHRNGNGDVVRIDHEEWRPDYWQGNPSFVVGDRWLRLAAGDDEE